MSQDADPPWPPLPDYLIDAQQAVDYNALRRDLVDAGWVDELPPLDTQLLYWHVVKLFQDYPEMAGFHLIDNAEPGEDVKQTLRDLDVRVFGPLEEHKDTGTPFHLRAAAAEIMELFRAFGAASPDAFCETIEHPWVARSSVEEWGFAVLGPDWQRQYQQSRLDQVLSNPSTTTKPRF